MYDKKLKRWIASEPIIHYQLSENKVTGEDSLYADYALADAELVSVTTGTKNVEAVYLMERTAKQDYAPACLAMAQMFEFGWAVAKNSKLSLMWYEKAANAGSAEAIEYIKRKKKDKRNKTITLCVSSAAIITIALLFVTGIFQLPISRELRLILPDGIELKNSQTVEQYAEIIREIQEIYDNNDMRNGKIETNRIILIYKGNKLNVSKFSVVAASTDGEMITLQFADHEETLRCYEHLKGLRNTEYISIDKYITANNTSTVGVPSVSATVSHSDISGYDYYSWGAIAMELDQYAAYLRSIIPNKHLTVAVIDTGIEPNYKTENRIVDGTNIIYGGNGKMDVDTHGTHVSGIILDCTQGLNIDVMPIGVFYKNAGASDTAICLGIKFAMEFNVKVINMSLGGPCTGDGLQEYYIKKAIEQGITVIVAAGNEHELIDSTGSCPAHIKQCITVGAVDENGSIASFSNYGDAVDVCAPGIGILSYVPNPYFLDYKDGTSMAAPHVAALASMISLEYDATPENIEYYIKVYSDSKGSDKRFYGEGMPLAGYFVEKTH